MEGIYAKSVAQGKDRIPLAPKGILPAFLACECPHVADRRGLGSGLIAPQPKPYIFDRPTLPSPPTIFRSLSPTALSSDPKPPLPHFHAFGSSDSPDFEPASSQRLTRLVASYESVYYRRWRGEKNVCIYPWMITKRSTFRCEKSSRIKYLIISKIDDEICNELILLPASKGGRIVDASDFTEFSRSRYESRHDFHTRFFSHVYVVTTDGLVGPVCPLTAVTALSEC